ncbi:MAG: ABC transporter ATP-binding protein [Clostridiales bacterium]|nr:ABC transporter ATP-binding protein [Clostridiales bacterium]
MLELKNISSGYGKLKVIDDISLAVDKGGLTSVLGINGCGKSTLLKASVGILPLFCGKIIIDGQDSSLMTRNDVAKRVSYLAQGRAIPDMTVEQMVLHGRFPHLSYPRRYTQNDKSIAQKAMETVKISDLSDKPLHTLSGGMRQTAYIAMALAQDTDYILLDEPTTYLDVSNRFKIMNLLKNLAQNGKGVVCVLHDIELALKYSDSIILMQNGKLIASGDATQESLINKIADAFNVSITMINNKDKIHYCIAEK